MQSLRKMISPGAAPWHPTYEWQACGVRSGPLSHLTRTDGERTGLSWSPFHCHAPSPVTVTVTVWAPPHPSHLNDRPFLPSP